MSNLKNSEIKIKDAFPINLNISGAEIILNADGTFEADVEAVESGIMGLKDMGGSEVPIVLWLLLAEMKRERK